MLQNSKKVAILMATYNGEKYVEAQLESILSQSYTDWSLYIRDDGSKDSTCKILESYALRYNNIHLIKDDERLGPKLSFIRLLENVESVYYMFADQDDYWLVDKIRLFVDEMEKSKCEKTPVIICSDLKVVDESLNLICPSFWKFSGFKMDEFNNFTFHWYWNNVNGCSMMINQNVKQIALPVPKEAFMHDSWIVLSTLAHNGIVLPIQQSTMLYRQHQCNSVGARRDKALHYITDFTGVITRTYNQYLTLRHLCRVSFISFLYKKIVMRINKIIK